MKLVINNNEQDVIMTRRLNKTLADIRRVDVRHEPIVRFAHLFFDALHLYDRLGEPELYMFLYDERVQRRMMDAFSRTNQIDGETLQRELNSDPQLAKKYKYFNKVYKKLSVASDKIIEYAKTQPAVWNKIQERIRQVKNDRRLK